MPLAAATEIMYPLPSVSCFEFMFDPMNSAIHPAINLRIKPGRESEFQNALHEILRNCFANTGVLGARWLVPRPDSPSPETGILHTFASCRERHAFYASPLFRAWEERIKAIIGGKAPHRELHGLEVWFCSPEDPPAQWKRALLTWIAVWPVQHAGASGTNSIDRFSSAPICVRRRGRRRHRSCPHVGRDAPADQTGRGLASTRNATNQTEVMKTSTLSGQRVASASAEYSTRRHGDWPKR